MSCLHARRAVGAGVQAAVSVLASTFSSVLMVWMRGGSAVRSSELAQAHALQFATQVIPGVVPDSVGGADEQRRQPAQDDVGGDALLPAVIAADRTNSPEAITRKFPR